ncbi:GNAT family N-acetyltransferase [Chitinimonas koreensis]|uniref:GNAT family N-acetyltransferase n=1 Tax=Chitinimonas koreensis TaxID=356302 RepID=UPI00041AA4EA|nr:GNAT family N-acetyltransferase [Chitinimonas koreensis]QNM96954.1 GNAT family N-acetyltransferase [Chitinimonas koreensis]
MKTAFTVRDARPGDAEPIYRLVRELADYEKLTHLCTGNAEQLHEHLWGARPYIEALVAEVERAGQPYAVGFAIYFHNYSSFVAKPGLYLEDLFVLPEYRRNGIGEAMFREVAARAVARGCGRFEWAVLDWNAPALNFYRKLGATVMPDWRICRATGDTLRAMAGQR